MLIHDVGCVEIPEGERSTTLPGQVDDNSAGLLLCVQIRNCSNTLKRSQVNFVCAIAKIQDGVVSVPGLEIENIIPFTSIQPVIIQAAAQLVVAGTAFKRIVTLAPIEPVVPFTASQNIVSTIGAAKKPVVTATAVQPVVPAVTGQYVIVTGTDQVFYIRDCKCERVTLHIHICNCFRTGIRIAFRMAALASLCQDSMETHGHARIGIPVQGKILARAARERVGSCAADEPVVARATVKLIIAATSVQPVAAVASFKPLSGWRPNQNVVKFGTGNKFVSRLFLQLVVILPAGYGNCIWARIVLVGIGPVCAGADEIAAGGVRRVCYC